MSKMIKLPQRTETCYINSKYVEMVTHDKMGSKEVYRIYLVGRDKPIVVNMDGDDISPAEERFLKSLIQMGVITQ